MPKLESVKSEPMTDDPRYMTLAPAKPAKLDLGASGELLDADYYQNKRARPIKHTADREVSIHFLFRMYALDERRKESWCVLQADKLKRTLFYLESVVYFVLSVRALGEARGDASQSSRPPTMIKDTCDLLRYILFIT